jgi:hypothetical protein
MMSPSIDPHVAKLLDQSRPDSDDEDALIAELENDDDHTLSALREQRVAQLHAEFSRAQRMKSEGAGTYREVKDEKMLMDETTSTKLAIVHFFKSDFGRCQVMDRHLEVRSLAHNKFACALLAKVV